jgi:hypothetical protein
VFKNGHINRESETFRIVNALKIKKAKASSYIVVSLPDGVRSEHLPTQ